MRIKPKQLQDVSEDADEDEFLPRWLVDETGQLILHMFYMLSKNKFYGMKDPQRVLIGPAFQDYVKMGEIESRYVTFWDSVHRWYRLACKKNGVIPLRITDKLLGPDEEQEEESE